MITWSPPIEVARGEAYQGPWRMNDSDFRYVDAPTVHIDGEGAVAVAWVDQARKDVFFRRYGPDGEPRLGGPVNVSRSPAVFSWLPRLAVDPGDPDRAYVLWQEIIFSGGSHGGEILFARSADGGRTFGEPVNLSNSPAGAGKGRLTARRWHNGSLDLALGPEGIVYVAWTVGEDPAADIRLARSQDGGRRFGEPRRVGRSEGHADAPKVAADGAGRVHLVYAESPEGPFGRYGVRYARWDEGARSFEAPREISGRHAERFAGAGFPDLALDGEGRLYVLWHLFHDPRSLPRGLGLAVSADGGRSFGPPTIVPGTAEPELGFTGSLQGLLMRKLAVKGAGEIAVVNSTFQPDESSRVRLILGRLDR